MDEQERMCKLCSDNFWEGSVNTNQYNLCEGSKCTEASELLEEVKEIEKIYKREDIINELLQPNEKI